MLSFILAMLPLLEQAFAAEPAIEGLAAAIGEEGALKALGGISIAEWIQIAEKVAAAAPAVQKAWAALHPAFDELVTDIEKGIDLHDAAGNIHAWFKANAPKTIPGYGADGGVTSIRNPDL